MADALDYLLRANALDDPIAEHVARLDFEDLNGLETATAKIRELIGGAQIPVDLEAEILERYRALVSGREQVRRGAVLRRRQGQPHLVVPRD